MLREMNCQVFSQKQVKYQDFFNLRYKEIQPIS